MIKYTVKFILRYNKWLLAGTLVLTLALFYWFSQLDIGSTYAGIFPPKGDPERVYLEKVRKDFGSTNPLIIAIVHDDIFSYETLSKIQKLTSEIEKLPYVEEVQSLTNATIIKSEHDEISLSTIEDQIPSTKEELDKFRQDILDNPLYVNNLLTKDERMTIVRVGITSGSVFNSEKGRDIVTRSTIERAQELAYAMAGPEKIYIDGPAALTSELFHMISSDISTYLPPALVIVVIILLLVFRRWWVALLCLLAIGMSLIGTYSIMSMVDIPLSALTATFPPIVAALGISYSIHLFNEYSRHSQRWSGSRGAVDRTLKNILLAIWLSAITTAIGFGSISLVYIVAIRRMGFLLVLGVLFLLLFITFFIPPALILLFRKPLIKHKPTTPFLLNQLFNRFVGLFLRHRLFIITITAVLTVAGIVGTTHLQVETDAIAYFHHSSPFRQAVDIISKRLQSTTPINIIMEGSEAGDAEDPELLKSIGKFQSTIEQNPIMGKSISMVDYIKLVNKAMHNNDPAYYVVPKTRDEISQYLLVYSLADNKKTLDRYVDYDYRMARLAARCGATSSSNVLKVKNFIEQKGEGILPPDISWKVTGEQVLTSMSAQHLAHGILYSFSLAMIAISVIMMLLFRSIKMGAIAMIPNLLPMIFILGLMGWSGIDFNIGTSIVVCLAIGIAVDDTIHFLVRYFYELKQTNHYLIRRLTGVKVTDGQRQAIWTTLDHVKRPIILTSVAIFLGFIVLAFSQFVPIMWFGILTAITMVFCLICDLIILPILLASISI